MTDRVRLGEVTCPSGALLLLDFGLLELWTDDAPPRLPVWAAPPDVVARANAAVDFEVTGPDADAVMGWYAPGAVGRLYDRSPELEAEVAERLRAEGLTASLRVLDARVSHRARALHAAAAGVGLVEFHGAWGPCFGAMATATPLAVYGAPSVDAGCWRHVELVVPGAGSVAQTRVVSTVGVDRARLGFFDLDALSAWTHHEAVDGRADYVFWGRDAAEVARIAGAPAVDEGTYGWVDLPVEEVLAHAGPVEALRESGGHRFATDFRPHSDHWRLLSAMRASGIEAASLDVGDARVCGFMTTWGDGVFDVEADFDATGAIAAIRVVFADA